MSRFCAPELTTKFKLMRILAVITLSICSILIGIMGITSIPKFRSLNQIKPIFKYLFHLIWGFAFATLVLFLLSTILCWFDVNIFAEISSVIFGMMCLFLVLDFLLLMLLTRLHFTFKQSMFRLTHTTQIMFITLYFIVLMLSCIVIYIISHRIVIFGSNVALEQWIELPEVFTVSFSIYTIFNLGTLAIATAAFAWKLVKLANMSSSSALDVDLQITLNTQQIKIIESATRYTSLLDIGMFVGFITSVLFCVIGYNSMTNWNMEFFHIVFILLSINHLILVVTTYLQFPFSTKYYYKYCKCNHSCWRYMLTQKAKKMLYKSSIENEMQVASLKANEEKNDSS